jgi:hypothetical protein
VASNPLHGYAPLNAAMLGAAAPAAAPRLEQGTNWWDEFANKVSLTGLIAMRMKLDPWVAPFEFIASHRISDDRYVVFLVVEGEAFTIEDGALFPSDALITQLRLLAEKGKTK